MDCKLSIGRSKAVCEFYEIKDGLMKENKENVGWKEKEIWKRHDENGLKVNCNGALDHKSFEARAGVVVRDCNGVVVDGFNRKFTIDNALIAKTMALRDEVKLTLEKKLLNVIFEIDARVLHNMLTDK